MRLTTSPPSCAECHEIWEPKPPGNLWVTPGLLWDSFSINAGVVHIKVLDGFQIRTVAANILNKHSRAVESGSYPNSWLGERVIKTDLTKINM
jgi:hypothetical protein